MRVLIPLGKSFRMGIILSIENNIPENIKCKDVIWPFETAAIFDSPTLSMIKDLSVRQSVETGKIINQILPIGLKQPNLKISWDVAKIKLNMEQIKNFNDKKLLALDFIEGRAVIIKDKSQTDRILKIQIDPPWPVRPAAKRQIEVLDYLYAAGSISQKSIQKHFPFPVGSIVQKLIESKFISVDEKEDGFLITPPSESYKLNSQQEIILEDLKKAFIEPEAQLRLLYGVTGSGKTAVYLEIIRLCLENGKNAFLLAPEVALAHKLYRDFTLALPKAGIILYHGYQSASTREKTWQKINKNTASSLIIGTRSSLFLPLPNIGCIILDEEHDASYKQDEGFSYNAKELAWFRTLHYKSLLILGSATPDIKTFHACETGRFIRLDLPFRVTNKPMPVVELIDIAKYSGIGSPGIQSGLLAPKSVKALEECKNRGEQAVILLNRRGYAPMVYCLDCAKTIQCPHCSIAMAYHKGLNKLVCHFCGYSMQWPSPCPKCGKMNFLPIGEGTEKIAESLEAICGSTVLRLDRDSTRRPGRVDEILTSFARQEAPFLAGTQMLSKGHHFPNVTLVIVADGDIGLNLPDYRAAEKTFQLLIQAAGRAGRGEKEGRVLIQTRDPGHYCWEFIKNYDYKGFYESELALRKKRTYPPFINLALLRLSFPEGDATASGILAEVGSVIRKTGTNLGIKVLGPALAPIPMLRGRRRYHCLLKASTWAPIRELYNQALAIKRTPNFRMSLDMDPVNML